MPESTMDVGKLTGNPSFSGKKRVSNHAKLHVGGTLSDWSHGSLFPSSEIPSVAVFVGRHPPQVHIFAEG